MHGKVKFFYVKLVLGLNLLIHFNCLLSNQGGVNFIISGYIEDNSTGERLIGATVLESINLTGKISNTWGFFSIRIDTCPVMMEFSSIGYEIERITFIQPRDTFILISLKPVPIEIDEVTVTASQKHSSLSFVSTQAIPLRKIEKLPVLMGETDLLKGIQLLPGVQPGVEGTSGIYIRGGSNDQNLILLDGVPVYNVNHLFGFFSVFNTDALNNVTLYKGAFPARYGGRISAVLAINMKEGNNKEFQGKASVGLLSSRLLLEGPIVKHQSSFLFSARRSYFDLFVTPVVKAISGVGAGYYFQDINLKANYTINEKNKFFLSVYTGKDKYYLKTSETISYESEKLANSSKTNVNWGNITTSLRYNLILNNKTFSNYIINYSHYRINNIQEYRNTTIIDNEAEKEKNSFSATSGIRDIAGKLNLNFEPNNKHFIRMGFDSYIHFIRPDVQFLNSTRLLQENDEPEVIRSYEFAAYIEDESSFTKVTKLNIGLRYSHYLVGVKQFPNLEPRLILSQGLGNNLSIKAAWSRSTQYLQLLSTSTVILPTDIWVPTTKTLKPVLSDQFVMGIYYNYNERWKVEVETYYKNMYNMIEYREGTVLSSPDFRWQDEVVSGKGSSYGIEFLINKTYGKNQGWVSYTLNKSERTFLEKNDGNPYPYQYDRRHVVNAVFNYTLNKKTSIGYAWVFMSGNYITLATGEYAGALNTFPDFMITNSLYNPEYYTEVNGYRTPAYHRLDISVNRQKIKKERLRTWKFGVYNVYARRNALFVGVDSEGVKQASILLMIPFVDYSINF